MFMATRKKPRSTSSLPEPKRRVIRNSGSASELSNLKRAMGGVRKRAR